jgi:hypothetical protein
MGQTVQAPVHSGTPRTQLLSIQYLRAIAALSVLVTHTLQWPLPEMNMYLLKTGRLGVEIFFIISGFIITTIAGDRRAVPSEGFSGAARPPNYTHLLGGNLPGCGSGHCIAEPVQNHRSNHRWFA